MSADLDAAVEKATDAIMSGAEPLTDHLLDGVIATHTPNGSGNCRECVGQWPCDAAVVAAVLKRERAS